MDILQVVCLFLLGAFCCCIFFVTYDHFIVSCRSAKGVDVPKIVDIKRVVINPGDILVLRHEGRIRPEVRNSLLECLGNIVPHGAKIMIADESLSIHAILQGGSLDVKEGNADANNSNKNSPEPFPLSEVKLNDGPGK